MAMRNYPTSKAEWLRRIDEHNKTTKAPMRPRTKSSKRSNPEKALEKQVLAWCRANGFDVSVIDSSTYGVKFGVDKTSEYGISDLVGNRGAIAAFIELKAPSKLSTLKFHQYKFLLRKLEAGCFACCVDSVERLAELWQQYEYEGAKSLISALPLSKSVRDGIAIENSPLGF